MSQQEHPVNDLMNSSMQNLRQLVDVNTIIGDPIKIDEKLSIIPISKVSFGFATAGSDLPNKTENKLFGGGSGSGVTINPLGFLIVNDGNVQLLQMSTSKNTADKIVNMVPEVMDKISSFISKDGKNKNSEVVKSDEVNL